MDHPLLQAADELSRNLAPLKFGPPVTHVYDPLTYARASYAAYLDAYAQAPRRVVVLGMNPGPWGMAQTGVPFGDAAITRSWLQIERPVGHPANEHPARPVLGFACARSEVSGTRLWGAIRDHFGTPARFFASFFVANYCPLYFLEESGRNRTPDRLAIKERQALYAVCDVHLRQVIQFFAPRLVIGVGAFAAARAEEALTGMDLRVGQILHPSPASPKANIEWLPTVKAQLKELRACEET
jgi:single-strand selective monofunctional uracil DNA glycosylase